MNDPIDEKKKALRAKVHSDLSALSEAFITEASRQIEARILSLERVKSAKSIGCFLSLKKEFQTGHLISALWRDGKRVCIPAFNAQTGIYSYCWLEENEPVASGPAGPPQPVAPHWLKHEQPDVIIVPGLAFNWQGRRLGRGGGHFDILLSKLSAYKIGVAFARQIFTDIPVNKNDIPMDIVVTEMLNPQKEK